MKKEEKQKNPWVQILIGLGLMVWGASALIYQMQPGVIGLKSIPIILLVAGLANLIVGIRAANVNQGAVASSDGLSNAESPSVDQMPEPGRDDSGNDAVYSFLLRSYEAWRDGYFDRIGDYYRSTATEQPPETLSKNFLNSPSHMSFTTKCFALREPLFDEVLCTIVENSFLVTDKCLYVLESVKNSRLHAIDLCDMVAYTNKGAWKKSGTINLRDGKEIKFKLDAVPDERNIKQLQDMLGCERTIET